MTTAKQFGVSKPISLAAPTEDDKISSQVLERTLRELGLYESEAQSVKREQVLGHLYMLCKDWVAQVMSEKGFGAHAAANAGVKICTSGSYRLGVHGPDSDIDTLCIAPQHVSIDDFFGMKKKKKNEKIQKTREHRRRPSTKVC
jgi:poly(A) polymerase